MALSGTLSQIQKQWGVDLNKAISILAAALIGATENGKNGTVAQGTNFEKENNHPLPKIINCGEKTEQVEAWVNEMMKEWEKWVDSIKDPERQKKEREKLETAKNGYLQLETIDCIDQNTARDLGLHEAGQNNPAAAINRNGKFTNKDVVLAPEFFSEWVCPLGTLFHELIVHNLDGLHHEMPRKPDDPLDAYTKEVFPCFP